MAHVQLDFGNDAVQTLHRGLDFLTSILLLTGQITIGGVFIAPSDFALSLSGPFTGSGAIGRTDNASLVLDGLDVIVALLLIINQINIIGTYITGSRFTIVVSGPPFGAPKIEAYIPSTQEFYSDFRDRITEKLSGRI